MANRRLYFINQDYYKIRERCLEKGELFYDDLFEHDIPDAMWLRPGKIAQDPRFFVEGASRFDVVQGKANNCWLIVAMANLTLNPTLFQHVVPKDQSFRENYIGMFRFRIWQCGKWFEVVVDDRLPTNDGKLMYAHSKQKNEFWSSLLEKAYAKVYGSYRELTSGWFCEGIVDFTGGIVERLDLSPIPKNLGHFLQRSLEKSSFMCVFMPDGPKIKQDVTPEGLVKGHGYSITGVKNVSFSRSIKSILLVRLLNPWGKIEWKGAWSDSSPEWRYVPDEEKREIGLVFDRDGEFWMSVDDFSKNFKYIDICHLGPELFGDTEGKVKTGWEENYFKGEWIKDISAGGFVRETFYMNPQYRITLTDTDDDEDKLCTVLVALMQKNKTRNIWYRINFTTFLLEGPEKLSKNRLSEEYINTNFKYSMSSKLKKERSNVVNDKWEPGVYCIIPSTEFPNQEGQFLLRVYSEKKAQMEENEELPENTKIIESLPKTKSQEPIQIQRPLGKRLLWKNDQEIEEYFNKIAGRNNEVGWEELQQVLHYAVGNTEISERDISDDSAYTEIIMSFFREVIAWLTSDSWWSTESPKPSTNTIFTKDECRSLITILDEDSSGKLGRKEFQVLWKKMREWESVFLNHSKGAERLKVRELKQALASAGYHVKSSDLGRLVNRFSDSKRQLAFDDFIMCAIELETETSKTQK